MSTGFLRGYERIGVGSLVFMGMGGIEYKTGEKQKINRQQRTGKGLAKDAAGCFCG